MKILLLSILAGVFSRCGGSASKGNWLDFVRHTKARDFGVPLCVTLALMSPDWITSVGLFFSFGLLFGALTLGYGGEGEPADEQSLMYRIFKHGVFYVVGAMYGIALFPYVLTQWHLAAWINFVIRVFVLAGAVGLIHQFRFDFFKWNKAEVEEFLRGAVIITTLILI